MFFFLGSLLMGIFFFVGCVSHIYLYRIDRDNNTKSNKNLLFTPLYLFCYHRTIEKERERESEKKLLIDNEQPTKLRLQMPNEYKMNGAVVITHHTYLHYV